MKDIYELLYPIKETMKVEHMYFRRYLCFYSIENKYISIERGGDIRFDTYYNMFSIDKWKKYTNINSLYLNINIKGEFRLNIYNRYLVNNNIVDRLLICNEYNLNEYSDLIIDISEVLLLEGSIFFEIEGLSNETILNKAKYKTINNFDEVKLGIVVCTFKREEYVNKMISSFYDYLNKFNNIKMFIIDNGKTLCQKDDEHLSIIHNENYGGASGFSRGLIEINRYNNNNNKSIDYILLMDDDILIDFNIIDRLISFLSMIKDDYRDYFIAGSMLSMDNFFEQYETHASWRGDRFIPFKHNLDLRNEYNILYNDKIEKLNNCSAGWWFSCFSSKIVTKNNYPFPCFFRGDDVEFTIRNGSKIINLNGLNVWHEPFYKKYSIVSELYYLTRNLLVINTIHMNKLGFMYNAKFILKKFIRCIITYDYKGAQLIIRALDDYTKGIDFFINTNAEDLNKELMTMNYKLDNIENILDEYRFEDINYQIDSKVDKTKFHRKIRILLLNGYLIPKFMYKDLGFANIGFGANPVNFYKYKNMLNYDRYSNRAYITTISKKDAITLTMKMLKDIIKFKVKFKKIKQDYQANFYKLQTEEFWKEYLKI